ncbi:myosin i myo5 [Anopheles sinensis]|uniref:Myosin i myo5 n=1 Tax=Anopheles sinensis TaxID=74873 RepID=A0A084VUS1_ANOSI|nr:myosin i myo5 [Anopheles sinensis]
MLAEATRKTTPPHPPFTSPVAKKKPVPCGSSGASFQQGLGFDSISAPQPEKLHGFMLADECMILLARKTDPPDESDPDGAHHHRRHRHPHLLFEMFSIVGQK